MHTLRRKGILETIAEVNHNINFGNMFDVMNSSRDLQSKLREMQNSGTGTTWAKHLARKGIHEEVELLQAYPSKANQVTVRGLGRSRELSLEDRVRLEYIDDIFGTNWGKVKGSVHPLLAAAPKLLERGYINNRQFESIKLYSELSSFSDVPGFLAGKPDIKDPEFGRILDQARNRLKNNNLNVQEDIVKFVSNRKLRNSTIKEVGLNSFFATTDRVYANNSPFVSVASNKLEFAIDTAGGILESVTNMMSQLVIPFKKDPIKHFGFSGNLKYLTGAMIKTAAITYAFKLADAAIASNPLLDNTSLESGITGAVADAAAIARLGTSRVMDALGVTGIAKYLNGVMPGFVTSAPGAIIGAVVSRRLGGGAVSTMKGFALGAIGNRILAPYLPDFTKTYDQLQQEYSGQTEVPMMKSPTWLLGVTPWEGQKVEGYTPNWYVRTKSRWRETDSLYGSAFKKLLHEPIFPLGISIGDFVDPYFMERKHYFSRPYPTCLFGEANVITSKGIKYIKDVKIGDVVYDINGKKTTVLNSLRRNYNKDIMYALKVIGQSDDVIVTSDHEIPVIKDIRCCFSSIKKSCNGNSYGICKHCTKKRKTFSIEWIQIKDISIGDFLVKKFIEPEYYGDIIHIAKYITRPFKIENDVVSIYDKLNRKTGDYFNSTIKISETVAYYFGIWLAEGWIGKVRGKNTSVNTVHNIYEKEHIIKVIDALSKELNLKYSTKDFGTYFEIYIHDFIFADIISGLFGVGSLNKKPINFSKELDRKVVAGIIYGDGHYDNSNIVLTSINKNILWYTSNILETNLIPTSSKKHTDNGHQSYRLSIPYSYLYQYRTSFDNNHKNKNIVVPKRKSDRIYFREGYILKRVTKKEIVTFNNYLYDLTVSSDTHSFSLVDFIVHNSGAVGADIPLVGPLIAGTLGRLIKPQKTMHQEFLSGGDESGADSTYPFANPPPTLQEGMGMMKHG
jgi:hypothetical protein